MQPLVVENRVVVRPRLHNFVLQLQLTTTAGNEQYRCAVQIRFQRYGRRKSPFYRIVAIDSKSRRQGIPIEVTIVPSSNSTYIQP